MDASKITTATGMCVIALTKHIMKKDQIDNEHAYRKLLESELYKLLNDPETRLFLENNNYLCEAYDVECREGKDGLYYFINMDV